jgi:protein arginine N-methyltransferase 5
MHGIAGYFEAELYKDVKLSILPATHSPGMFSWFPIYFPICAPVYLQQGMEVEIHFWRCTDARKVWYEWSVLPMLHQKPMSVAASRLANPKGRSYWIGL